MRIVTGSLPDEERRDAVYAGQLLVFTAVAAMRELCRRSDELIREHFGSDPVHALDRLGPQRHATAAAALRADYRQHPQLRELFLAALTEVGVDLDRTYWDRLYARVAVSGDPGEDTTTVPLAVHRDTWSSNIYAQTNWWAPIYPITPERGLAFYRDYWSRPLANDSGDWDLQEVRARRRAGRPVDLVPHPTEPVEGDSELRVDIAPGDLLCFSGAHLHAGVPNHTGVTRFSIETRTVDATDVAAGRGAPNVDGAAPHVAHGWFRRVSDGSVLTP